MSASHRFLHGRRWEKGKREGGSEGGREGGRGGGVDFGGCGGKETAAASSRCIGPSHAHGRMAMSSLAVTASRLTAPSVDRGVS
eukprot:COSAG02_NODE_2089_length_9868_cov_122.655236_8_plen_84_part_00